MSKAQKPGIEFVELDASWAPWKYQINKYVEDGAAYGRPEQKTYFSMGNFLTLEAAHAALGEAK